MKAITKIWAAQKSSGLQGHEMNEAPPNTKL
jgi:hypothetical protein